MELTLISAKKNSALIALSLFALFLSDQVSFAAPMACPEFYMGQIRQVPISEESVYKITLKLRKYFQETGARRIPIYLTAKNVAELKNKFAESEPIDAFYFALLGVAQEYSINFSDKVGAVAVAGSGNVYFGFNIEFPGLDVGSFIHAEQVAIANARIKREGTVRETQVDSVYISAAPCGSCRQMLLNVNGDINIMKIKFPHDGKVVSETLPKLIRLPFGDLDLNLLDIRNVTFSGIQKQKILQNGFPSSVMQAVSKPTVLQQAALKAAREGYTNKNIESYRGAALELISETGRKEIFSGSYLEATGASHSIREVTQIIVGMRQSGYSFGKNAPMRNSYGEKIVDARAAIVQGNDYPFSNMHEYVLLVKQIAGSISGRIELVTYQTYNELPSENSVEK